jgi:hypothetical protein
MFSKLKRLNTSKQPVHVTVELISLRFAKKDAIPAGTEVLVVYEKHWKKKR